MTTPNQTYMEKADLTIADLIADGGYLQDEEAKRFIRDLIKESMVVRMSTVYGMKSHTRLIDKIGFDGRVLRPAHSATALPVADRSKPTTDQVTLATELFKAEVRLNDEVLEDNIEGGTLKSTVMQMFAEQISLDMDEIVVNGDTLSADPFLAKFDGWLKLATSHIVNAGTVALTKAHLKAAVKAMPSPYNRNKRKQRYMISEDGEVDYRDAVADRATVLGDKMLQDDVPVRYASRPLLPIPVFPDDLGVGSNCTNAVLTDPKNSVVGIWRKVKIRTGEDIVTGEWVAVATVRFGFQWMEEDAVVKITNVKTQ